MQSGSAFAVWAVTADDEPNDISKKLVELLGCTRDNEPSSNQNEFNPNAGNQLERDILQCMQSKSTADILEAQKKTKGVSNRVP